MSQTFCPSCSSPVSLDGERSLWFNTTLARENWLECKKCDHLFRFPVPSPSALHSIYSPDYYPAPHLDSKLELLVYPQLKVRRTESGILPCVRVTNRMARVALMRRPVYSTAAPIRILEIGSADGSFSDLLRRHCPYAQVVASEFSAVGAARTRKTGAVSIRCSLTSLPFPDRTFDIVVLFHVLEHLTSPRRGLSEIRRVLKDAGLAIGAVPCYTSMVATINRDSWILARDPGHLHLFSGRSLGAACSGSGLKVIWSASRQAPWNVFPARGSGSGMPRASPERLSPRLGQACAYPLALVATALDCGDELDFVATQG